MSNVEICADFFRTGLCATEHTTCGFNHAVPVCTTCKEKFSSISDYSTHVQSAQHKGRAHGNEKFSRCTTCQRVVGTAEWPSHLRTKAHLTKSKSNNVDANLAPVPIKEDIARQRYCAACDIHVQSVHWAQHTAKPRHQTSELFSRFMAAIEESSKNRNGVLVSEDTDFGVVSQAQASQGLVKTVTINTANATSLRLMHSSLGSGAATTPATPIFAVHSAAPSATGQTISIRISARTSNHGIYDHRLELLFENTSTHQRFLIIRQLSLTVGNAVDREAVKPTSPFVKKNKKDRAVELEIVEGLPVTSVGGPKYIRRLPKYLIQPNLLALLSDDSKGTGVKINLIRSRHIPAQFDRGSYAEHFKNVLWVEEYQADRNLDRYDMSGVTLKQEGRSSYLAVPGLAEKRPSVLLGDLLLAHIHGDKDGKWYAGHVHNVRLNEVGLGFHSAIAKSNPTARFDIRFKLNRTPFRRQHQAMSEAFVQARVLFPTHVEAPATPYPRPHDVQLQTYDSKISMNPSQLQAVVSIVEQAPGSVPFVVFGPPGTGKTVTIVEAIRQVLEHHPDACILACAPSNAAADIIAERLVPALGPDELFRAYGPSRSRSQVPDTLTGHILVNGAGTLCTYPVEHMLEFKVIVSTCVSASIFPGIRMPRGHFTHIFIDEAAQATEPEVMISLRLMVDKDTNIILSGDPKQLGPVIQSGMATEFGLGVSYLERLMKEPIYDETQGYGSTVVKLVKNFRSHPTILHFPNDRFYRGDLQPCAESAIVDKYLRSSILVNPKFPVVFHSVSGSDTREASSPSFFNVDEASLVKEIVMQLLSNRQPKTAANDIGIIAPYQAQCGKIRKLLKGVAEDATVGSVEQFQGQERPVIIISTVRSSQELVEFDLRHTLGFVANPRRFNVAVTRAKALLIVVGDPTVLSLDPLWRRFLNYVHDNNGWKGPGPTWDTQVPVDDAGDYAADVRGAAEVDMNALTRRMEMLTMSMAV